jgi:hypothetical protein
MKFGIFDHIERRRAVPLDQQYRDRLEWVAQAAQAGFHCYHVAKHRKVEQAYRDALCESNPPQSLFDAMHGMGSEGDVSLRSSLTYDVSRMH